MFRFIFKAIAKQRWFAYSPVVEFVDVQNVDWVPENYYQSNR